MLRFQLLFPYQFKNASELVLGLLILPPTDYLKVQRNILLSDSKITAYNSLLFTKFVTMGKLGFYSDNITLCHNLQTSRTK